MRINLSDIARGRRIVAVTARDLRLTRHCKRPDRKGLLRRVLGVLRPR